MNERIRTIITAAGVALTVLLQVVAWSKSTERLTARVDTADRDIAKIDQRVDDLESWQDAHTAEVAERRTDLAARLTAIEVVLRQVAAQLGVKS